jgi:signal transduction histidine kinase
MAGVLNDTQHEYLAQIERATKRLEFMVNDLLDLARIDAGTFQLRCAEADLSALIREIAASVQPLLADHQLELVLEGTEAPLLAPMDAQRIERVLSNYLSNALKFTPPGGHIRISARCEGEAHLVCEVSDDGPGIAPEELPRLFQRFSQLTTGMAHKGGTGLGLSISKTIVEAHGGTVGVRSVVGKGSTFWFALPVHPDEGAAE